MAGSLLVQVVMLQSFSKPYIYSAFHPSIYMYALSMQLSIYSLSLHPSSVYIIHPYIHLFIQSSKFYVCMYLPVSVFILYQFMYWSIYLSILYLSTYMYLSIYLSADDCYNALKRKPAGYEEDIHVCTYVCIAIIVHIHEYMYMQCMDINYMQVHVCMYVNCIVNCNCVFDKLVWHTIGSKSFLLGAAQFSL